MPVLPIAWVANGCVYDGQREAAHTTAIIPFVRQSPDTAELYCSAKYDRQWAHLTR